MIARGYNKGRLEFYLVKKPRFNSILTKKSLFILKKQIRALKNLIHFSLLELKEKSLYNIIFPTKNIQLSCAVLPYLCRGGTHSLSCVLMGRIKVLSAAKHLPKNSKLGGL